MAVENTYWWYVSDFYASNTFASWSLDVNIPAQSVYAYGSFSTVVLGGNTGVFCGVSLYFTREQRTGPVPIPHFPVTNVYVVIPGILDNNVVSVGFMYGAIAPNNGQGSGDCTFQIFGFG
jgi:hypothetical protein